MTADNKSDNTPLSITDRYAQLGRNLRKGRFAKGRVTPEQRDREDGRPVGADAHLRARQEGEKAIKERAARRIGRNDPESIQY